MSDKNRTQEIEKGSEQPKNNLKKSLKLIHLSDGSIAQVRRGKGHDVMEAQKIAGTNPDEFQPALMSRLVLIDGKAILHEDLLELPAEDYLAILGEFAEQNFTSEQGK